MSLPKIVQPVAVNRNAVDITDTIVKNTRMAWQTGRSIEQRVLSPEEQFSEDI